MPTRYQIEIHGHPVRFVESAGRKIYAIDGQPDRFVFMSLAVAVMEEHDLGGKDWAKIKTVR